MKLLLKRFSFITLLTVLLLCNAVSSIGVNLKLENTTTTVSQEQIPNASLDILIPRIATQRIQIPETQIPTKDPALWPIAIMSIAVFIALLRHVSNTPRGYLSSYNHRLAGWQDNNLQFRFIHTR